MVTALVWLELEEPVEADPVEADPVEEVPVEDVVAEDVVVERDAVDFDAVAVWTKIPAVAAMNSVVAPAATRLRIRPMRRLRARRRSEAAVECGEVGVIGYLGSGGADLPIPRIGPPDLNRVRDG